MALNTQIIFFQASFYWGPPLQQVRVRTNKQDSLICLLQVSKLVHISEVEICPRVRVGSGREAQVFCPPLHGVVYRGYVRYPVWLCSGSSEVAVGFWSLCIFCPEICLNSHAYSYFQSHAVFLCIFIVQRGVSSSGTAPLQQIVPSSSERTVHSYSKWVGTRSLLKILPAQNQSLVNKIYLLHMCGVSFVCKYTCIMEFVNLKREGLVFL